MIHENITQGSPEWHALRARHFGASEAAAMLGVSPHMSRDELLRLKHIGIAKDVNAYVQAIFDNGHVVEESMRSHVESSIGEDLYQLIFTEGKLIASVDGINLIGDIAWEHKQYNEVLYKSVMSNVLPEQYMPQCQQILMLSGAEKLLFSVSNGEPDKVAHMWVSPDTDWFKRLRDGWTQFDSDLANYEPKEVHTAPTGRAPDTLPALRIEISGQVTASNLSEFKTIALAAIRGVNRDLATDQDFADAEKSIKWCSEVESRLSAAKEHALSQTSSIDALFKTVDDINQEARRVRLELEKLVARRKDEIKAQAIHVAKRQLDEYVANINSKIAGRAGGLRLQPPQTDFAGAIKGLRTTASMDSAIGTTLANAKIVVNSQFELIEANLEQYQKNASGFEFIFSDLGSLLLRPEGDFLELIKSRIVNYQTEQQKQKELTSTIAPEPAPIKASLETKQEFSLLTGDSSASLSIGTICERLGFTVSSEFLREKLGIAPAKTIKNSKLYTELQYLKICDALAAHIQRCRVL